MNVVSRLSGIEETDDTLKPAIGIELATDGGFSSAFTYWGRNFGPVVEKRYLLSFFNKFSPFKSKRLLASLGGAVLHEITTISYDEPYTFYAAEDIEWNLGLQFGIYFKIIESKSFVFESHWESAVFPAGYSSILLVTGRKQTLGLSLGVSI